MSQGVSQKWWTWKRTLHRVLAVAFRQLAFWIKKSHWILLSCGLPKLISWHPWYQVVEYFMDKAKNGYYRINISPEKRLHSVTDPKLGCWRDPLDVQVHLQQEGKTKTLVRLPHKTPPPSIAATMRAATGVNSGISQSSKTVDSVPRPRK